MVPADARGTVALARSDARVLARYESFTLVEAQGRDGDHLRQAGAERRDDMLTVETAAGEFDPAADRASLAGKQAPDRDAALVLVQFVGPPKDAWVERLAHTGARIVSYQAENAYIVHAHGSEVDRVAALQGGHPAVRTVSVLTSADKLEDRSSRSGVFAVTTVTGAAGEAARDEAAQAGPAAGAAPLTVGTMRTDYRALSSSEVAALARAPGVVAIEAFAEPELFDERAAQIVAGQLIPPALTHPIESDYGTWLVNPARIPDDSTFDFSIDVTDEGLDNGANPAAHPDFRTLGSGPSRVAYLNNYTTDSNARDCGGHGTNVASIATGYNDHSNQPAEADDDDFNHGMGVAPFARVGASKIFRCGGGISTNWTPAGLAAAAYTGGARISNNSWGTIKEGNDFLFGEYTSQSAAYDHLVRDAHPDPGNQPLVEVFAAGNDGDDSSGSFNEGYGTISAEGSAKNVITVGASENRRLSGTDGCGTPNASADSARDIVDFSSRGPTDDGRLKPDLVAPGTHVTGAAPQHSGYTGAETCDKFIAGSTLYSMISGTSQAAPQVSGAAALVRRWYEDTEGVPPSPALTKALLVNTATDLGVSTASDPDGGDNGKGDSIAPGPNMDQGWGRVNVGSVFDSTPREFRDQLPADVLGTSGDSRVRAYEVQDTNRSVKVTLVWTDAPGPLTGSPAVSDLDLVVDVGGRTYMGNVFAGQLSRTGGTADRLNNVESVHLPAGTAGRFAVRVVGTNIPGDGVPGNVDSTDQDFALVVSNADEGSSPVLVHEQTTIDDSPAAGGDGDGALEPTESFRLEERLRNAGDAGATSVSGTLSATSGLTVIDATSTWPNIAVGASQPNDDTFAGQITASCGQDAVASLSVTTGEGPHAVPLTLPTGTEGTPVSLSRTHPPGSPSTGLDIPDDSAAGVTSTITMPAGRIKDLDVRIADLDHGWVGDLRIDITSPPGPDSTTVTLVAHPGGPDNGGKNMVNTVFDDEAARTISAGSAPYTGRFRPQNDQLSRFDGKPMGGVWTLRVRDLFEGDPGTLDAWGLEASPATCGLDSTAPDTTIDAGPVEGSTVANPDPQFSFSSNAAGATFECQLDGAAFTPCSSPQSYAGLLSGTHTFRVRAVDGSDPDPTPATRTWTIDRSAPNTTITAGPSGRVGDTGASFQFVSADAPEATFECKLDDADFSACPEPQGYSGLSEGTHTFQVRAWDAAGNVDSTPASRTWTVDLTAPVPSIDSPGQAGTTTDITPAISGTAGTGANDSTTVIVKVYAGGAAAGAPIRTLSTTRNAGGAWSVSVTPALTVGQYTVQAQQADDTVPPNVGLSAPITFNIGPDPIPPETTITSAPASTVASEAVAFTFDSNEPGSSFSCSLNGAAPSPCDSPHVLSGLSDGTYTLAVTAIDPAGNPDPSPATSTWSVDVTPPTLTVTAPSNGQTLLDTTPTLRGTAGTAPGDAGTVTVKLWNGALAAGMPQQMLVVPRDPLNGAWSAEPAALAVGNWTVQVEQSDSVGHVGASAPSTFAVERVDPPPPPEPPSFLLAPVEERMADALAGRLTVVAACATACQVNARLTVSARASRSLGLGRKSTALGSGRKKLTQAGTAATAVKLTKRARSALRRRSSASATLRVTVAESGSTLSLSRTISLRRSAGLKRIASRGLRLWALCSESCPLSGKLTLSPSAARTIGLKPKGSARMQVASGNASAAANTPTKLSLKVRRGARKALRNAKRVGALLEAVAGPPDLSRSAKRRMTLRR